jgi:hypothetical protein
LYFPDRVNGPFDERSGICEGYIYTNIENNGIREIAIQDQWKLDKNATHATKKSLPQIHQDHPIMRLWYLQEQEMKLCRTVLAFEAQPNLAINK